MMKWGSKYRNKKQALDGYSFASQLEASLYCLLKAQIKNGELTDLKCQPNVYLTEARILTIPDFSAYDTMLKETIYAEGKGFETAVWRIKRRLWIHYGPGRLYVYHGTAAKPVLREVLCPKSIPV